MPVSTSGASNSRTSLVRAIIGAAILLGLLYVILYLFYGAEPVLAEVPWYNPMMFTFLALTSLSVAFLAFGRYQVLRDPVSFWIGMGFSGLGIGLVFYVLAWPGLLPGGRSIIAHLPNTAGVMSVLVHVIPGVALLAAASAQWPGERALAGRRWLWLMVVSLTLVALLFVLVVVFERYLPVLVTTQGKFTAALMTWNIVLLLVFAAGTVLSARRHLITGDALLGYVAVFQISFIFSSVSNMIGDQRYDLWWYLNRVVLVSGSMVVLFGLLSEYVGLLRREREKTERLRESEEDLNRAQAVAHTGSWRLDFHKNELLWSEETYRMFGIPREIPMTYETFLGIIHPEDKKYVDEKWNAALRGEPYDIEHRIVVKGDVKWVRERAELEFNSHGQLTGGFGTVQDITERRRAEQREKELESRQFEFYRRTILAATNGKLCITHREDIEEIVGEPTVSWEITDTSGLAPLRQEVASIANSDGMDRDKINRVLTCVAEAATNSLKHAGRGIASVHRRDGVFVFAVSDTGPGMQELSLPDVALVMGYSTVGTGGMGYKLMITSADKVYLATGPDGTIVACEFSVR